MISAVMMITPRYAGSHRCTRKSFCRITRLVNRRSIHVLDICGNDDNSPLSGESSLHHLSIKSSTLQYKAIERRETVSTLALLISLFRCSYIWNERRLTPDRSASSACVRFNCFRRRLRFTLGKCSRTNEKRPCRVSTRAQVRRLF